MGSKPVMMPETPATVSPLAGWQRCVTSWICWMVTESTHVAFGNCVAEATPATQSSAATARKRVNILLMGDPLVAGGQERMWERDQGVLAGLLAGSSSGREPERRPRGSKRRHDMGDVAGS